MATDRKQVNIRMDKPTRKKLDKLARVQKRTITEVIHRLIDRAAYLTAIQD